VVFPFLELDEYLLDERYEGPCFFFFTLYFFELGLFEDEEEDFFDFEEDLYLYVELFFLIFGSVEYLLVDFLSVLRVP